MRVYFSLTAEEHLARLPRLVQIRIVKKLEAYAGQSDPLQFAEPLTGVDAFRFRIGDYRVIFEVLHGTLWILAIKRRDEAYR
jgi:mRNA-degrading endonuclease RelE of RelBE toxin-antitoxin system